MALKLWNHMIKRCSSVGTQQGDVSILVPARHASGMAEGKSLMMSAAVGAGNGMFSVIWWCITDKSSIRCHHQSDTDWGFVWNFVYSFNCSYSKQNSKSTKAVGWVLHLLITWKEIIVIMMMKLSFLFVFFISPKLYCNLMFFLCQTSQADYVQQSVYLYLCC